MQDELRRAMFQRQRDFERQQQWQRSLETQRAGDQERFRQMLQRNADLGRLHKQEDASRRLEDLNRDVERLRQDEIRRRHESFRIQHLVSRPPPRIQWPEKTFVSNKLSGGGQPSRPSTVTFPPMVIERTRNLPHRNNGFQLSPVVPVYRPTGGLYC
jgi:hypothetical protein